MQAVTGNVDIPGGWVSIPFIRLGDMRMTEISDPIGSEEHPHVVQVAVIGIPHDTRGEQVKVFVVLREGETATDEVLWSQSGLIFKEQYDVPPLEVNYIDEEDAAQLDIATGVAGALVTSIFEGF